MRVGLVGSRSSPDLLAIKRELEDRGHKAAFVSPRKFPQYTMAGIAWTSVDGGKILDFDHTSLLDFACFYLGEFDVRDRFFRGEFGRNIWVALQDRYQEHARCETENLAFQTSLALCLAEARPIANSPASVLAARLRLSTYFRLERRGLPVATYSVGVGGAEAVVAKRVRIGEDYYDDVPCFPRDLAGVPSLRVARPRAVWRVISVKDSGPESLLIEENGTVRCIPQPEEATLLAEQALVALGLDFAEIHMGWYPDGLKVVDVLPFPAVDDFEEATGVRCSRKLAERLLWLGGLR